MNSDNSAARLLALLEAGKEISPKLSAKDAWKSVLSIKGNSLQEQSTLMAKLGQIMLLPHDIRTLLSQYYPEQTPALDHTLNQIQKAFMSQNLAGNWETFINHIDQHCLSSLSLAKAMLDMKLETKVIEQEKLDSFKASILHLIEDTVSSELSNEFKKFMTHYLNKILTAINDYLISGAMPILDAVEATLGHAVLDPQFKNELKSTDTGTKIRDLLGDLANVVTVATAATGAALYISSNGFPLLG